MRTWQRSLADMPLVPLILVAMLAFTGAGWNQIVAAGFAVVGLLLQKFAVGRGRSDTTVESASARTTHWLTLPAIVVVGTLVPAAGSTGAELADVIRVGVLVTVALIFPTAWGGWQTSSRWL